MPYQWSDNPDTVSKDTELTLTLWPHRSLTAKGFSATIWVMFFGALIPIVPFIGTPAFWVLLCCLMLALYVLWTAIRRSDRDGLREQMTLSRDALTLTHWTPKNAKLTWQSNTYWVQPKLYEKMGVHEKYLTLKGDDAAKREVELGSFLSPKERETLNEELARVLARFK